MKFSQSFAVSSPPKNKCRFAISREQDNLFHLNLTSCKHRHRYYGRHSNFWTAHFLKAYVTSNCGRVPHDLTHDLTCTWFEIAANKNHTIFSGQACDTGKFKKNNAIFDPQENQRNALPNLRCWLTTSSRVKMVRFVNKSHYWEPIRLQG